MKPILTTKPTLADKASVALAFAEPKNAPIESENATDKRRAFTAPEGHRRLTINLPEDLHKKLRLAAVERDCNATDIIVKLLEKELSM